MGVNMVKKGLGAGRGYFGIGVENIKTIQNLGTLFRSSQAFAANFTFIIGKRLAKYNKRGDTGKSYRHTPFYEYKTIKDFKNSIPKDCTIIGIEIEPKAVSLVNFIHPERALYLLGAEDGGLSEEALSLCNTVVKIPSQICLNVATAGSIVMYDRLQKRTR
jgi:tRNA G18 (ribose-2'-O)-methylase SpoU